MVRAFTVVKQLSEYILGALLGVLMGVFFLGIMWAFAGDIW